LSHGSEFGNLGHRENARPSCGWPYEIDVGQLTGYEKEDFLIQLIAPFVIRRMRQ